jgi:hypothetical protein
VITRQLLSVDKMRPLDAILRQGEGVEGRAERGHVDTGSNCVPRRESTRVSKSGMERCGMVAGTAEVTPSNTRKQ